MNALKGMTIGLILILMAVVLSVSLFYASRGDPSLRIAALVCVTTLVTGLTAIASTLLIGKDITHPQDLPPNSSLQQTTTLNTQVPPDASKLPVVPEVKK